MRPYDVVTRDGEDETEADAAATAHARAAMVWTREAGKAIIRVVGRVDDAKENSHLDLSECELMSVPEAIFLLLRHTRLLTLDLSRNTITKLPPRLATNFAHITQMRLCRNRLSKLPDEVGRLSSLTLLDISCNSFVSLPPAAYALPQLTVLLASNNYIADVDGKLDSEALETVDLRHNPLSEDALSEIGSWTTVTVHVTPPDEEEEEDLPPLPAP